MWLNSAPWIKSRQEKVSPLSVFFLPPGSVRMVRAEGMPQYRNPFDKGDLYVKFDVQFPQNNWISPEKLVVCGTCCFVALQHVVPFHGESDSFPPSRSWRTCCPHDQNHPSSPLTQKRSICRISTQARAHQVNAERPTTTALTKRVATTGRGCNVPTSSVTTCQHH